MSKLDELIEVHEVIDRAVQKQMPGKGINTSRDTAAALRLLRGVADAADLAIDSGSVDEIHLSIIRDRLSALRAAGLMEGA